eukprot:6186225-Pleurochrysis_carterae.AAC.1
MLAEDACAYIFVLLSARQHARADARRCDGLAGRARSMEEAQTDADGAPPSPSVPAAPSLNQQRLLILTDLVMQRNPRTIVDVGCGEARLLSRIVSLGGQHELHCVVGVDAMPKDRVMRRGQRALQAAMEAAAAKDCVTRNAVLLKGSLLDLPAVRALKGFDVLLFVEVVEHLDPPELSQVGPILLGECAPRCLVVTTPNKEYNLNFIRKPAKSSGELHGHPPPIEQYELRNSDHRFEWTRAEFMHWAGGLADTYGYSVRYLGIGGGPMDEENNADVWHGPGPQTQVAVFELAGGRVVEPTAFDSSAFESIEPMQMVWCSAQNEIDSAQAS